MTSGRLRLHTTIVGEASGFRVSTVHDCFGFRVSIFGFPRWAGKYGNYVDEVLRMTNSSGTYYYGHDQLYSPVILVSAAGSIEDRYGQTGSDPFSWPEGPGSDPLCPGTWPDCDNPSPRSKVPVQSAELTSGFTGREVDYLDNGSLSLQYNRHRYYSQDLGRWTSEDPLGIDPAGNLHQNRFNAVGQYKDGATLYEYAQSAPIVSNDPFGLFDVIWTGPADMYGSPFPPSLCGKWIVETPPFDQQGPGCNKGNDDEQAWWDNVQYLLNKIQLRHAEIVEANPASLETGYKGWTVWGLTKAEFGVLKYGTGAGTPCKCATCDQITSCWSAVDAMVPYNPNPRSNCQMRVGIQVRSCCAKSLFSPQPQFNIGRFFQ